MIGREEYERFRPAPSIRLGSIYDRDGVARGSAGYYKHQSGAEVVAFSSIAWSWGLDNFASGTTSVDSRAQRMVTNALRRWTGASPTLAYEVQPDSNTAFATDNAAALVSGDIALEEQDPGEGPDDPPVANEASGGGCSTANHPASALAPLGLVGLAALLRRLRR